MVALKEEKKEPEAEETPESGSEVEVWMEAIMREMRSRCCL